MLKIGIISNIYARMVKNDPNYNTRLWYCLGNKGQFEVTQSLTELEDVCKDFKSRGINLIGIVGGDGTISLILSLIYKIFGRENLPKILVLKGGTINFLASNLGLNKSALATLKDTLTLLDNKQELHEYKYFTLKLNQEKLGFVFGNGLVSSFLHEFYKDKKGKFGALVHVGKLAADYFFRGKLNGKFTFVSQSLPMYIQTAPESFIQKDFSSLNLVLASTVPKLAFGFNVFRKLDPTREFAQLIASNLSGAKLVGLVNKVIVGIDPAQTDGVFSVNFNSAKIISKEQKYFSLDGDLYEVGDDGVIQISIGPQFTFCSPYKE